MVDGFDDLADELEELANTFDTMQSRDGTEMDARGAIEDGVHAAMEERIVPEAESEGRRYVPTEDAHTIDHRKGMWSSGRYQHLYYATSDLVKYHEFGTGGRASDSSEGTVEGTTYNGDPGYIIRPNGNYPLGIPSSRWRGPDFMVQGDGKVHLEYVVHPGVHGKHFMRRALQDNTQEIQGFILSRINEMFRKNGLM